MIFDTKEIVIGGTEWKTAPFRFGKFITIGGSGGASYTDVLLSGVSPLVLTNAIELNYVKAFGATEQKSSLPSGYTQVEYLESTGTQYINTKIRPNANQIIDIKYIYVTASLVFGCRISGPASYSGIANSDENIYKIYWGNKVIYTTTPHPTGTVAVHIESGNTRINGNLVSSETYGSSFYDNPLFLFNMNQNGIVPSVLQAYGRNKIISFSVTENGAITHNLIACRRNSDSVLGMYDTVEDKFLTNAGTGTFTAGSDVIAQPTPDNPMDIVCNNGVLKVNSQGQIYTDGTVETVGIDTTGDTATAENLFAIGDYKDEQELLTGVVTRNVGVKVLDGTEDWTRGTAIYANIPDLDAYLGYKDCYCTHFLGVNNSQQGAGLANSNKICIGDQANVSQYRNSVYIYGTTTDFPDVTTWTQWLADQYAAGTPVIVVYPLATATTETVTGQPLTVQTGTNIVSITQASIDDLTMELSYKQSI